MNICANITGGVLGSFSSLIKGIDLLNVFFDINLDILFQIFDMNEQD
jgi:hypothetical protein